MRSLVIKYLIVLCPLLIYYGFNHQNIPLQFSLILGGITLPYVSKIKIEKGGFFYAILALIMGLILVFFRSSSVFYFFTVFVLLFTLEQIWGRLNLLPLFLVIIVSPFISNIVYIWSFPIRLKLTAWAGSILSILYQDLQVQGNLLFLDGHSFSVDPACIGLKMVITSLVLGLAILAFFEKRNDENLSFLKTSFLLSIVLLGAVLANFIRLLTLVVFHILPENPLHDVIGILSLSLYTIVPFYFLVKYIFKNKKNIPRTENTITSTYPKYTTNFKLIFIGLLLLQFYIGRQFLKAPVENYQTVESIEIDGFNKTITPNGVLKFQNDDALIYIKPPVQFFQGSHDPRFCWQGSGYTFSSIQIERINNREIYTAILNKGADEIYTAWWFENATDKTPHDWTWRWKTIKGESGFYMVNLNCDDRNELYRYIDHIAIFNR